MFKDVLLFIISFLLPVNSLADEIRPEQIVKFKEYSFGCVDEDTYKQAMDYLAKGEKTKFESLDDDITCAAIPTNEQYKILSMDVGFFGSYVEFTHVGSGMASGFWTDYYNIVGRDRT